MTHKPDYPCDKTVECNHTEGFWMKHDGIWYCPKCPYVQMPRELFDELRIQSQLIMADLGVVMGQRRKRFRR
jgi:hypothetical protein